MFHGCQKSPIDKATTAALVISSPRTSQRTRLRGLVLTAASAVTAILSGGSFNMKIQLGAAPSTILPITGGGVGESWYETLKGVPLSLALSDTVQVDGVLYYDEQNVP